MKKDIDKKVFGATFTKKGAKHYLFCLGCGTKFVRIHPTFNNCPTCLCCHYVSKDSVNRPFNNVCYVGKQKIDVVVKDKHIWWSTFGVFSDFKPDKVVKNILRQVNEIC